MIHHRIFNVLKLFPLLTALTPLVFISSFLFPYIVPKLLFVRGVIQISIISSLVFFAYLAFKDSDFLKDIFRSLQERLRSFPKLFIVFGGLFIVSYIVSTLFSINPYRSFWGTIERGEGLFNFIHFLFLFLIALLYWEKREFSLFFKTSVVVGLIVYFYAFLQIIGFTAFPFALETQVRPGSFLGNPAFLAAYTFFVMISALLVLYFRKNEEKKSKFWAILPLVAIMISPIIIFLTRTRGAIVGLALTLLLGLVYLAFHKDQLFVKKIPLKKIARTTLIMGALFLIFFLFTKGNNFWQNIPGFDRLARTSFVERDASSQTRILGWKLGIDAIQEKPFLGWGPEQYLYAFQKLYYPEFTSYGETWLDKAHNKFIDVGVDQGILGFIAYIGFIVTLLLTLLGKRRSHYSSAIGFLFLGYFVQNIFLFDELNTFPMFFAFCASLPLLFPKNPSDKEQTWKQDSSFSKNKFFVFSAVAVVGSLVLIWGMIQSVVVPAVQAYYTPKAEKPRDKNDFNTLFNRSVSPYNFAQYNIRAYLMDTYYVNQSAVFGRKELEDIATKLISSIQEVSGKEPYDIRFFVREAQAYTQLGKADPSYYKNAEQAIKKAIEIAPRRPDLYYALAIALAGQERFDEAIQIASHAIELNPKVARAYYHLAVVSVAAGDEEGAAEAMRQLRKIDPLLSRWSAWDFQGILIIYEQLDDTENIVNLITDSAKGINAGKFNLDYYEKTLAYYAFKRDKDNFIAVAGYIKNNFPTRAGDMEVLIDLAKNENWEIIHSL